MEKPLLSRQIKGLEEELETLLLERGAHSAKLTIAGKILMVEARKLVRFSKCPTSARQDAHGPRTRLVSRPLEDEPAAILVAAGILANKPCTARMLSFIEELKRAAKEV